MKRTAIIILLGIISVCCACDPTVFVIAPDVIPARFVNSTDEVIYVGDGTSAVGSESDEAVRSPYEVFRFFPSGMVKVEPKMSYDYMQVVYDGSEKERLYHILILKEETMQQYTPEELKASNIYDKWYVMTFAELEACNYRIVYDGR